MPSNSFNYQQDFDRIDFRQHPERYQIGKGEQGVLLVEPYKSEILPFWRFKTPDIARESADKIYQLFLQYLDEEDLVGADMARKFLQMGYTRARRYANYKGGKKYARNPQKAATPEAEQQARQHLLPRQEDPVKAESARIFKEKWELAKQHPTYRRLKEAHRQKYAQ